MKVVHVLESLQTGGMERLVVDLAKRQKAAGFDVFVYTVSRTGPLEEDLLKHGVPCVDFHKECGFDIGCLFRLRKAFLREKFDVVHTHNAMANIYAAPAAKAAGVGVVVNTRHGAIDPRQKRLWLWKSSFAFTDRIVFVCDKVRREFEEARIAASSKCVVVYNGIPLSDWPELPPQAGEDLRREWNAGPDEKIIGAVCRLDVLKDIPTLIKAFEIVVRQKPQTQLVIIGHGPQKTALEEFVRSAGLQERVRFLGERKDVKRILPAIDVFALPTLAEGLSIALLEAMACRRTIVTTDVGGNPELIVDRSTGLLVKPGKFEDMAERILECLNDPRTAAALGANARRRVETLFDIRLMTDQYQRLYEKTT